MATTWDSISGGLTETIDYKPAPSNVEMYPDNSNVTILGQVWLPRVYGKNLTSFEIASSGKIAITVNDIHSMDILSSNMNGIFTNRFSAKSNYSMDFFTQGEDTRLLMDGSNKNVSLYAKQAVDVWASNDVLKLRTGSNVQVLAENNIEGVAQEHIVLQAVAGTMALTAADSNVQVFLDDATRNFQAIAQSNVVLDAGQDVLGTASNSVVFNATFGNVEGYASSNALLQLHSNWHTYLWARSNVEVTASNEVAVVATNNIGVSAALGGLTMNAGSSNVSVDLLGATNDLKLYAKSNVDVTASNSGSFFAQSNLSLTASSGNLVGSAGSNVQVTSVQNTLFTAQNQFNVWATGDLSLNSIGSNFGLYANASNVFVKSVGGSNLELSASSNVGVTAAVNAGLTATSGDVNLTAGTDVQVTAAVTANMQAAGGDTYINLSSAGASLFTLGSADVTASNGVTVDGGEKKVLLTAEKGAVTVTLSNSDLLGFATSNISLTAGSNIVETAAQNVTVSADAGNMLLTANASNVSLLMDAATNSLSVYAQSNVVVTASNTASLWSQSNVSVTSAVGSLSLGAADQGVTMVMDTSKGLTVYSSNTASVTSSNSVNLTSVLNTTVLAQSNLQMTGGVDASLTASTGVVNLTAQLGANLKSLTSNVYLYGSNGTSTATFGAAGIDMTALNSVHLASTTSTVGLYAADDLVMSADTSNVYLKMAVPEDTLSLYALSNVNLTTGQNIVMTASSNVQIGAAANAFITASNNGMFSASNNLTLAASNTLYLRGSELDAQFNNISWTADSNINFKILSADSPGDPVFTISSNEVRIRGNIVVTGELNTSNIVNTTVVQQTLKVSDRVVKVANSGNGDSNDIYPFDGFLTNDDSGLVVDGLPETVALTTPALSNAYEKALKWHYGDDPVSSEGCMALGTDKITKEAFWEMTGGSFRLTHKKVDGQGNVKDLSFGFRVNELEELELVKKYWSTASSSYVYKRVARFGRIIL